MGQFPFTNTPELWLRARVTGDSELRAPTGDWAASWTPLDPRKPPPLYFSCQLFAYIRYEGTARDKEHRAMQLSHERGRGLAAQRSNRQEGTR
jgi:hypothetical protein